jgi:hypothetical protein
VFVQGVKHSGTTILYRMLAYHPDLTWFSQYSLRDGSLPGRRRLPGALWADTAIRRRTNFRWAKERHRFEQFLTPRPVEGPTIFEYLAPESWHGRIRTEETLDAFERFRAMQGRPSLIVKLPRLWDRAEAISRMAPDTRQVHIVRDPWACAMSLRETFRGKGAEGDALLRAARYWRGATEAMQHEERRSGRVLTVRYEELCDDLHGTIERCLAFCGLDHSCFPYDRVPGRLVSSNARWYELIDEGDESVLRSEFGDRPASRA